MRKIETDMLEAVRQAKPWASGNTTVVPDEKLRQVEVFLHGHRIARYWFADEGQTPYVTVTHAGHPTNTTLSRLRAILGDCRHSTTVNVKRGNVWYSWRDLNGDTRSIRADTLATPDHFTVGVKFGAEPSWSSCAACGKKH